MCGARKYPVHRVLLATRSTFFEGACRNSFLEAETGVINLSEDDAEAVEHMIYCIYSPTRVETQTNSCPTRFLPYGLSEEDAITSILATVIAPGTAAVVRLLEAWPAQEVESGPRGRPFASEHDGI